MGAQAHLGEVLAPLLPGQLFTARGQGQQIFYPQALKAGRLLKAIADAQPGPAGNVQVGDVGAIPGNGAPGGLHKTHDGLGQRGLTTAIGAGDDYKLIILHREGDVVEDAQLLSGFAFHLIAEVAYLQHWLSLLCKFRS